MLGGDFNGAPAVISGCFTADGDVEGSVVSPLFADKCSDLPDVIQRKRCLRAHLARNGKDFMMTLPGETPISAATAQMDLPD